MASTSSNTPGVIFGAVLIFMAGLLSGCGSGGSGSAAATTDMNLISFSDDWPEAGTDEALCNIPAAAQAIDSTIPDQVVGDGTTEPPRPWKDPLLNPWGKC